MPGASSTDLPSAARQGAGALRQPGEKPLASPAVRQRAADQGIDLRYVPASGGAGQITHNDLDAYAARKSSVSTVSRGHGAVYAERSDEHAVPVIGLRRDRKSTRLNSSHYCAPR